jgi:hypothetical protein
MVSFVLDRREHAGLVTGYWHLQRLPKFSPIELVPDFLAIPAGKQANSQDQLVKIRHRISFLMPFSMREVRR